MHRLVCLLLFGLCFNIFAARAQGDQPLPSTDPPYPCPYTNGAYYQPNLFPRFEISSKSLVLVDMTTGETVRVLDTLTERNIRLINWSPDCHYLSGAVGEIRASFADEDYVSWNVRDIVFWDAVNGERIHSFINPGKTLFEYQSPAIWSPDNQHALVLGGCPSIFITCAQERERYDFLWTATSNTSVRPGILPPGTIRWFHNERDIEYAYGRSASFNQYYWDLTRGWLWGSAPGGVVIYNINDGSEVAFFSNCHSRYCFRLPDSRFVFSPDGKQVAVYGIAQPDTISGELTVYDIATKTGMAVNVENFSAPYIPFADYHPVALSPDNRYLVVGYDALRVWDLQNLPEKVEARLPIYRHGGPKARIWSVRFAAPEVIETTSEEGTQRWDLHTGGYIP